MADRERSLFTAGLVLVGVGLAAAIGGFSVAAISPNGSDVSLAPGTLRDAGLTDPVGFESSGGTYAVRLVTSALNTADIEREARTTTCELVGSDGVAHTINGADVDAAQYTLGVYLLGEATLPAGDATLRCGWAEKTDADARRGTEREFDVVEVAPTFVKTARVIGVGGLVAAAGGAILASVMWRRSVGPARKRAAASLVTTR